MNKWISNLNLRPKVLREVALMLIFQGFSEICIYLNFYYSMGDGRAFLTKWSICILNLLFATFLINLYITFFNTFFSFFWWGISVCPLSIWSSWNDKCADAELETIKAEVWKPNEWEKQYNCFIATSNPSLHSIYRENEKTIKQMFSELL